MKTGQTKKAASGEKSTFAFLASWRLDLVFPGALAVKQVLKQTNGSTLRTPRMNFTKNRKSRHAIWKALLASFAPWRLNLGGFGVMAVNPCGSLL
jgi:hypothetical protein